MEVKGWVGEGDLSQFGKKKMFNYLHFKIETPPFHLPPLFRLSLGFYFPCLDCPENAGLTCILYEMYCLENIDIEYFSIPLRSQQGLLIRLWEDYPRE